MLQLQMKLEQSNSPIDTSCGYNMSLCLRNIVPFFKSYIWMGQVSGLQAFMESLSLKSGSHQNSTAARGFSSPPLSACARTLFGQGRLEILNALSRVTQGDRLIQTWPIPSHMNGARMCLCVCVCFWMRQCGYEETDNILMLSRGPEEQ